jgi:hypothetical protein
MPGFVFCWAMLCRPLWYCLAARPADSAGIGSQGRLHSAWCNSSAALLPDGNRSLPGFRYAALGYANKRDRGAGYCRLLAGLPPDALPNVGDGVGLKSDLPECVLGFVVGAATERRHMSCLTTPACRRCTLLSICILIIKITIPATRQSATQPMAWRGRRVYTAAAACWARCRGR